MKQWLLGHSDMQAVEEGVCAHLAIVTVEDAKDTELLVQVRFVDLLLFSTEQKGTDGGGDGFVAIQDRIIESQRTVAHVCWCGRFFFR